MRRILLIVLILSAAPLRADVSFANLFGNHMVLQRGVPVRVWGTADPGESVTLTFGAQSVTAVGNSAFSWAATLVPMTANATGQSLSVQSPNNTVTFTDVVVGDVFLCSGQSNMEYTLQNSTPDGATDATNSDIPDIRMINIPKNIVATPVPDVPAGTTWWTCTPANAARTRNFSGLAFYVGRTVYQNQGVPLGLIGAAYGGMSAEAYMSLEGILSDPVLAPALPGAFDPNPSVCWPTGTYNAMIAPLTPFAIAAVLWDQGEANEGSPGYLVADNYRYVQPALIKDWRLKWGLNFPFFLVQIQNMARIDPGTMTYYSWSDPAVCQSQVGIAGVRWGQFNTLKMPGTGMSVNFDLNPNTFSTDMSLLYHPPNKEAFAARLSPWVENVVYGASTATSQTGPLYDSYAVEGVSIRLHFTFPQGVSGLSTSNAQPVTGFQIASAGSSTFQWATAVLDGTDVLVGHPSVTNPGTVRYAWSHDPSDPAGPVANLSDSHGWLASPFQTFDFSVMQVTYQGTPVPDLNLTPSASDGTDFGDVGYTQPVTHTFVISNAVTAGAPLTLTGGVTLVRVGGDDAGDFTVLVPPALTILPPGATTSFLVRFQPSRSGTHHAILRIPCNTPEKTPYTIHLQANGVNDFTPTPTPTGTWYTPTPTETWTFTSTWTRTPTPDISTNLIDDFENTAASAATRSNLWGGSWSVGVASGSTFNSNYASPGAGSTSNAVSFWGNIAAGGWSNYLCCLYAACGAYNASGAGMTGIQFWIYGDGNTFRASIRTTVVTDYDDYGLNITPPAGQWTFYRIPFTAMGREGWGSQTGLPVIPTADNITGVKFDTKFTGPFAFMLDQVAFYRVEPTATPTATVTYTPSPTPTGTWFTDTPTVTATPTLTHTPTITPTFSPTRSFTPTVTVTPTGTWDTPTPTPTDGATYPFEDGTVMGWTYVYNGATGTANSADRAYRGSRSLAFTMNFTTNDVEVGTNSPSVTNFTGRLVTAWVWVPMDFPADSQACLWVKSGNNWAWNNGALVTLTPGAWNLLTFDPANPAGSAGTGNDMAAIKAIGIQVLPSAAYSGTAYVDSVNIAVVGGNTPTPTRTLTPTSTHTVGASNTWTSTITATPMATDTPVITATNTESPTPSHTPTFSATSTPSLSPTSTLDLPSSTSTPTASWTFTYTYSPTRTASPTFTPTATWTGTATSTWDPSLVSPTETPTSVVEVSVHIWPNPVIEGDEIQVELDPTVTGEPREAVLFTVAYRRLMRYDLSLHPGVRGWTLTLRDPNGGRSLSNGLYYLWLRTDSGEYLCKILVLR